MTPRTPQCEVFCPLLSSSEHSGVPEDSQPPTFPSVGLHPHTWPKWGCDTACAPPIICATINLRARREMIRRVPLQSPDAASRFLSNMTRTPTLRARRCGGIPARVVVLRNFVPIAIAWSSPVSTESADKNMCSCPGTTSTVATPLWPSVGVKPNTWKSWRLGVFRDSRMFRAR